MDERVVNTAAPALLTVQESEVPAISLPLPELANWIPTPVLFEPQVIEIASPSAELEGLALTSSTFSVPASFLVMVIAPSTTVMARPAPDPPPSYAASRVDAADESTRGARNSTALSSPAQSLVVYASRDVANAPPFPPVAFIARPLAVIV